MTEHEWLTTLEIDPMWLYLRDHNASERKMRHFVVACWRHVWQWLNDERNEGRTAVEIAERMADGIVTQKDMPQIEEYESGVEHCCPEGCPAIEPDVFYAASLASDHAADIMAEVAGDNDAAFEAELTHQSNLLRDIFGNPFRPVTIDPSWLTPTVTALALTIYDNRRFEDMPILADALEEAGCTNEDILHHCRSGGEHARGCWVVDLLLGKS